MRLFIITSLLLLISFSVNAQSSKKEYLDNTLIIKFKSSQDVIDFKAKANGSNIFSEYGITSFESAWSSTLTAKLKSNQKVSNGVAFSEAFEHLENIYIANYSSSINPKTLGAKLSSLEEIEYAEPRFLYYTSATITNDPIVNNFISYHNFDKAWDISKSSSDIIIGIVDSGVNYNHEDLENKKWVNEDEIPDNGIDDDLNGFIDDYLGWDFWESGYTNATLTQDNNPFAEFSDHGTHVSGIATADPNNGLGLAGTGFNARYMAVKAGGVEDDSSTPENESNAIGFGYEGILYAFMNGAEIINCSWGGTNFSSFGEDIVNSVTEAGGLIIAAAGNDNVEDLHYPSSLANVLSVGSVEPNNTKTDFSNFGFTVDVFATGIVQSSNGFGSSNYATYGGTSMSSPVVAGLAALIKTAYPDWSPQRIKHQIRSSSISIDSNNPTSFAYKLGTGKIDAEKALLAPLPAIAVDSVTFLSDDGNPINLNSNAIARIYFSNVGAPTSINVALTPLGAGLTFQDEGISAVSIPSGSVSSIDIPVVFGSNFLGSLDTSFRIDISESSTAFDEFIFSFENPLRSVNFSANNLAMSFSPNGSIGFYNPATRVEGIGFVPNPDTSNFSRDNLLYEGGIIFEANDNIANNIRTSDGAVSREFNPSTAFSLTENSSDELAGSTVFSPKRNTDIDNARITLNTYAFDRSGLENSIILNYVIENTSSSYSLSDAYLGIFNDWDVGDFANNNVSYNAANDILLIEEGGDTDKPLVAVATFSNTSSLLGIDNGYEGTLRQFQFSIFDGYSVTEKQSSLRAGTNNTEVNSADISTVVASGPYYIPPNSSVSLGFIYAFGYTEQELIDQINNARALSIFDISDINENPNNSFPTEVSLFQNYPNPFNPSTNITFNLSQERETSLVVYNVLGQKVRTVIDSELPAGIHSYSVSFDNLSSGLYFAILDSGEDKKLIKLNYIK